MVRAALIAIMLAGCGPAFELAPPDRFVTLDRASDGYAQRSLTADGVVLAVRYVDNRPRGPLSFWVDAIRGRLRNAGGYALLSEHPVRAASGQQGHQMRMGREEAGHPYVYWITIFQHHDRLVLVEAGGRRDRFAARESEVARSIERLSLR